MTDQLQQPDRRGFLRIAGLGGLAVAGAAAGVGALGNASPALADPPGGMDPITVGNIMNQNVIAAHGAGWSWSQWCQKAQYYAIWAVHGSETGITTYPSAQAAYNASAIVSTDPNAAPAGSFSYWTYSNLGHVTTNIGGGYCINTSSQVPRSQWTHDFGNGLYISSIAAEPLAYLGWSYGNGANGELGIATYQGG